MKTQAEECSVSHTGDLIKWMKGVIIALTRFIVSYFLHSQKHFHLILIKQMFDRKSRGFYVCEWQYLPLKYPLSATISPAQRDSLWQTPGRVAVVLASLIFSHIPEGWRTKKNRNPIFNAVKSSGVLYCTERLCTVWLGPWLSSACLKSQWGAGVWLIGRAPA